MTTKQYTRKDIEKLAECLSGEGFPGSADMLRQCLARIDQLEAEPSEAEVEAVAREMREHEHIIDGLPFTSILPIFEARGLAKAAIAAFLKSRRGQ